MLPPTLNECRPRIHVTLSLNSNALFRLVYGPSVLSPKPLNPVMPIDGIPQASGGFSEMPGMFSSLIDVALERQLASERVEEVVEAEPEFVDDGRRHASRCCRARPDGPSC